MPTDFDDGPPPYTVAMHVNIRFVHVVTQADNMDAAAAMVRSQIELFVNKAKAEAEAAGIQMKCGYMVAY